MDICNKTLKSQLSASYHFIYPSVVHIKKCIAIYNNVPFFRHLEYIYTRETPAFGGISLALLGSGAHLAPVKNVKKNCGACGAPQLSELQQGHEDSEYVLSFEIGQ